MKLIEHKKYPGMFYLQWPDGSMSKDFYNKTRARDFLLWKDIENYEAGKTYRDPLGRPEKLTGAFKSKSGTRVALEA